jgi:hypothetical protein
MKTILLDEFTNTIAVACSEEQCIINYFDTVEHALKMYSDAIIDSDLDKINISIDNNSVIITLTNQKLILNKEQAYILRSVLESI